MAIPEVENQYNLLKALKENKKRIYTTEMIQQAYIDNKVKLEDKWVKL